MQSQPQNQELYVKYKDNQAVKINTHFNGEQGRIRPLKDVADLVAAYKTAVAPLLDHSSLAELTLHLPEGVARTALDKDCFADTGTTLDPGCSLATLGSFGSKSKKPLVIKSNSIQNNGSSLAYWKVSGHISNSLSIKGVRSRMYRNADTHLGYYEVGQNAFSYDENGSTLIINVLFKTEENALRFESHLRGESITLNSPMNSLDIIANVVKSSNSELGSRIYYKDYTPTDSESPQETESVITHHFSTIEETSDEFKYQRIEKFAIFGSFGKADSCHIMSSLHCKTFPTSYEKYDRDPNNRLAMSRDLHGWFDNLNSELPLFYLKIVSKSEKIVVDDRYKIILSVVAYNQEAADMIFSRLIEGSTQTSNPLIMNTYVHITKPTVFQTCLEWKERECKKFWERYERMDSAVP
jgi:hypothetical protein